MEVVSIRYFGFQLLLITKEGLSPRSGEQTDCTDFRVKILEMPDNTFCFWNSSAKEASQDYIRDLATTRLYGRHGRKREV